MFYDTVHVNSENVVHFVDDIYRHDWTLEEAFERGCPYPEASQLAFSAVLSSQG
jgi:hypothetical protein